VTRRWLLALAVAMISVACQAASRSAAPSSTSVAGEATPTAVPAPPTEVALAPPDECRSDQIELIDVEMGREPGLVAVRVRPAVGEACVIQLYPAAVIQDAGGQTLATSRNMTGAPEFYSLDRELAFDLGWSVVCPSPKLLRPLVASVAFADPGSPTRVPLPDAFRPDCVLFSPGMEVTPGFDLNGKGSEGGSGG
jgi:hypothetical protein